MRSIAFTLLLIASSLSYAGCVDLAEFKDEKMRIYIGDGGCGSMEIIIWEYKDSKTKPSSIKHIDFDKECRWDYEAGLLSCRTNPENPLSGATYKRFKSGSYYCSNVDENSDAYKYKCIKGCKGKPALLNEPKNCS